MQTDRAEFNSLIGNNALIERELLKQYQGWDESSGVFDGPLLLSKLTRFVKFSNLLHH